MSESPTRQLAAEHEYVKLVVGAMEAEAAFIERTGRIHEERVIQMVDFTRNFTDGDHHTKEEDLLFPLLEERSAAAGGTISVLLSEHQAARDCIRAIDAALPEVADPDPDRSGPARAVIAENLKLYANLLPLHIGKEDTVLFPLTEQVLSVREQEMLGEEFTRLSAVPGRAATAERYHHLAHELSTPPVDG
ncbi:MAG TPA: hemerythrin domain-containing protein [Thermoleophilia bacterium]|nr:hemerythrin domain-containing protein [Thermoleophilia bacterium]